MVTLYRTTIYLKLALTTATKGHRLDHNAIAGHLNDYRKSRTM